MRKFTLKPAALYIITGMLALILGGGCVLSWLYLSSMEILMYVLIAIFIAIWFILGFLLLPMYFRRTVIFLSPTEITLHTGIIFLRRSQIKLSSAQYVTRISAPLSGFSGFNFLVIHALGGSLILPFLSISDCDELERAIGAVICGEEPQE